MKQSLHVFFSVFFFFCFSSTKSFHLTSDSFQFVLFSNIYQRISIVCIESDAIMNEIGVMIHFKLKYQMNISWSRQPSANKKEAERQIINRISNQT